MKKYLIYLLILLAGVAVLDVLNRMVVQTALVHLPDNSELRRSFRYTEPCGAELLVLGASRGVYDYNTIMMADSLDVTCESIAMEGMSVISQFISIKKAVAGGKTNTVLYDLSQVQLSDDWVLSQMSRYYPFYWENEDVRSFIDEQQGKKMRCLLSSSFVQYNSMLFDILYTGYMRKADDNNGYIALEYTGEECVLDSTDNDVGPLILNPTGELYLQKIVDVCKENNVRLILCDAPRMKCSNQQFDNYLKAFAEKNQIEFWNYSDFEPILSDLRYFYDPIHINGPAADIFTKDLIDRLRDSKELQQKTS